MTDPLLEVQITAGYGNCTVLHDLQFSMQAGERLGLVGTSGAGKSTLLLALLGLLPWRNGWTRGEVRLNGVNLLALHEREARQVRGKRVALVPQNPCNALNSALSLQTHFQEAWRAHEAADRPRLAHRMEALLQRVKLPSDQAFLKRKPGEISVGQAQRCALALALLHRPALVIADEPTSALDPSTQVDVLELLRETSCEGNAALLFVSHDLLSVLRLCTRIAVLHEGSIAESLATEDIASTRHVALQRLIRTLPAPPQLLLRYLATQSQGDSEPLREDVLTHTC